MSNPTEKQWSGRNCSAFPLILVFMSSKEIPKLGARMIRAPMSAVIPFSNMVWSQHWHLKVTSIISDCFWPSCISYLFWINVYFLEDYLLLLLMEEILHPLVDSLSHYLQGFIHPRWLAGFHPSTVNHHSGHFPICSFQLEDPPPLPPPPSLRLKVCRVCQVSSYIKISTVWHCLA